MDTKPENGPGSDTPNQPSLPPPHLRHQFSNVILNGSTFNDVDGEFDNHYHFGESSETGLHLLRTAASLGAIHDSSERFPAEKCEPGTRERTIKTILDWIKDPDPSFHVFWLYGSSDEGTTAVLQSIAESCASSDELKAHFGGSFFFSKDTAGRDKGHHLFLTIACQLAVNVPILRDPINRIICANPALPTKSISVQLDSLILRAFQSLEPDPQLSITVIIDGLDQCQDNDTQLLILHLIADVVTGHKAPLRFLIGSRPKPHICGAFDEPILYSITQSVLLDKAYDRKQSARPQNGGRLNSDNSAKIGEQSEEDVISDPENNHRLKVSEKTVAFLQKSLNDLMSTQAKLIENVVTLKAENGSLERRLKIRDERIQNLEAILRDADMRLGQQNKQFEVQLQKLKERLDRTREARKSGQLKFNFSNAGPSENPAQVKGPDEARKPRTSWLFTHAPASENPTEGKGPDEASVSAATS